MSFRKTFFRNIISLGVIQATNLLLPLIVIPLVIDKIGTSQFGQIAFIQLTMYFLSAIVDFGYNITGTRKLAISDNKTEVSKIFSASFVLRGSVTIILFFILCLMGLLSPEVKNNFNFYLVGFIYVVGQLLIPSWIFHGFQKMHYSAVAILAGRILFFLSVLVFITQDETGMIYLSLFVAGNLVSGIIAMILAIKLFKLKWVLPEFQFIVRTFKENFPVLLSGLSIQAYLYITIVFLKLFTNDVTVALYAIADRIIQMCRQMLSIYSQATFPQVCALKNRKEEVRIFTRKIYLPFLFTIFIISASLSYFSENIIFFFLHSYSSASSGFLSCLAWIPLIVCLNIPSYQLLLANDRRNSCLQVLIHALMLSIFSNLLFGYFWGANGMVMSIILTEIFITVSLNLSFFKFHTGHEFALLR